MAKTNQYPLKLCKISLTRSIGMIWMPLWSSLRRIVSCFCRVVQIHGAHSLPERRRYAPVVPVALLVSPMLIMVTTVIG